MAAPTAPSTIDALPTPPTTSDPTTFDARADATLLAQQNMVPQQNAANATAYTNALIAYNSAAAALASQTAAAASAGAALWVSGTTYAINDCRISPITYQSYRRKTVGAGTTDPSADGTNWVLVVQAGEAFSGVTSTAVNLTLTTAHLGQLIKMTATGRTITFPAIAGCPAGSTLSINAEFGAGSTTLAGAGAELLANAFGVTANTFALAAGESIQFVSNGTSWDPIGYEALNFPSMNGGPLAGMRNRIINGAFSVNQRAASGTVTLAAGAYGHDRWKAGAAGCTYTFATVGTTTTLTISAGSLVQVIEGLNVEQTAYVMSWTGTAQGRILAGSYAASPVALTATAGSNLSVEIGTGTLTKAQVEPGALATPFEQRPFGLELSLCQRYFQNISFSQSGAASTNMSCTVVYPQMLRAIPTIVRLANYATANEAGTTISVSALAWAVFLNPTASALAVGGQYTLSADL